MQDIYDKAKKLMKGYCRVCPNCDGRACAGEVPGMGGLGTGASFKANVEALKRIRLNMRLIHDVTDPDTSVSLLGLNLSMPVLAAPIGGVSFNMGGAVSEEEYIHAVVFGCREEGIIGCTGDGVPDFIHETGLSAVQAAGGHGIPFIKPWADRELFEKMEKVRQSGAGIMGMDIDAAGLITLRRMGRPVGPKTLDQLKSIIDKSPGRFILKGILTVSDAELAVRAGAHGIVVSNHGGRVLEDAVGAAEVLSDIRDAVKGRITILVDGGVRTGADVLKLMALGADAVMIGRPFSVAAVGGLKEGVKRYIDKIRTELEQAMVLTGTPSLSSVSRDILRIT